MEHCLLARDFVGAQRELEILGELCHANAQKYELCAAYADLGNIVQIYMGKLKGTGEP